MSARHAVGLLALVATFSATPAAAQSRFLRQPDVGNGQIAFVHANDVWTVGRSGGRAVRLTTAQGAETHPHFSADGQWIAFSGEYGGNTDVFVVPATGGQPKRLTWHPGNDVVQGWTPSGEVLFQSGRQAHPTQLWHMYSVPTSGGLPAKLSAQAYEGELNADGSWFAYQELGLWDPEWRNHRGGQAQPVSLVSTETNERLTPPWEGERHLAPVWLDSKVFYMSERDYAANVWSFDPATGTETQHTYHADFDVKSLGAGDGVVVYEQAGYLHALDPATNTTRQLDINASGDQNWARTRWEDAPATQLRDARLSPTGQRALFEYRGELFSVPAGEGSWRNLTRTPGVADRHAAWSPDGSQIAWFNDAEDEYALVIADQDGTNQRRISIDNPTFYFQPQWSPDGTHIAFTDTDYRLLVLDVESGDVAHADTERYAHPERTLEAVWSPDSRWVAYARRLDSHLRAIFIYDTESGESHQLTDGMADAITPVWDASGEYLYFLASTDVGLGTGWLDMSSFDHPVTRALYLAILKEDGVSPFMPKSDEEPESDMASGTAASGTAASGTTASGTAESGSSDAPVVTIDFEGINTRIVDAPGLPLRNYTGLRDAPEGHVFVSEVIPNEGAVLYKYSLDDADDETFIEGFQAVQISHDRKQMLYRQGPNWSVVSTGSKPSGSDGRLTLGLRVQVEPMAEWGQMLRDGWRFMRDFLYVDNQHGAPWDDVWDWYSAWLPDLRHRSDFNHLLDMVSGEIAVGHSYVRGGDYPELDNPRTGLLGIDLEEADGAYRISRIYSGEGWTPGLTGPLSVPGMGVHEGDYLLRIDGQETGAGQNPYAALEGTAGRVITITVADDAQGVGARDVVVRPASTEGQLRNWAWVAGNQRRVDELSGGKLAYVWLPNTGQGGYTYFNRMYFAQQDRKGAVIDERNNGGGSAADYIVDIMARELTGYFNSKADDHRPFTQPIAGLWGPKVMIINGRAGSGGDLMPYLFRAKGVGPLVGTNTWGGLVGTWDTPPLIDGGSFVAPRGGFYDVNGEWAVEATGVAPDIEVRNNPAEVLAGADPQLEAAVAEALRLLETEGIELMAEPEAPVRYRRPGGGR